MKKYLIPIVLLLFVSLAYAVEVTYGDGCDVNKWNSGTESKPCINQYTAYICIKQEFATNGYWEAKMCAENYECVNGYCITPSICPAVCVPMWELKDNSCVYNECGSGCGVDNKATFSTEQDCKDKTTTDLSFLKKCVYTTEGGTCIAWWMIIGVILLFWMFKGK